MNLMENQWFCDFFSPKPSFYSDKAAVLRIPSGGAENKVPPGARAEITDPYRGIY
jgi:hypothetical protein